MLTPELLDTSSITDPIEKALELTARMGAYNQPEVASDRYRVGLILGQAGVSNGTYSKPAGVNLAAAQTAALSSTQAVVRNPANLMIETNGWVLQDSALAVCFIIICWPISFLTLGIGRLQDGLRHKVLCRTEWLSATCRH